MIRTTTLKFFATCSVVLFLAACESTEEKAEKYYESGLALMEAGDLDRAIVEFRNVFQLNEGHREARTQMARIMMEKDNPRAAYGQYLRLVEQYPDDFEGRLNLAEIAFELRDWKEMDRHGTALEEMGSEDNPRVKVVALARTYRTHATADDATARRDVARQAKALEDELPDSLILNNIAVDNAIRENDYATALAYLNTLIAKNPTVRGHHDQRLEILVRMNDLDQVETRLKEMVTLFPDDNNIKSTLLRFYSSRKEVDKAEAFLRKISDPTDEDIGHFVSLIRFLAEVRGSEVALTEIERGIAENSNKTAFRTLRAGIDFNVGERDKAVAELEDILKDAEDSEETNNIRIVLARMLLTMGNEVGARQLVETVLAANANHVGALKIQAAWQIENDDTDGAIANLRLVLDSAPEDAQATTLMADAHIRAGNHDLARDFLSLAVKASGNAPAETIRYARVLLQEGRHLPAEDVLIPALRLQPNNPELLLLLGQLYIAMDDEGRAQQVAASLRRLKDLPGVEQAAISLEADLLSRSSGIEDAMSFLQDIATQEDADLNTKLLLLRARIGNGETEAALALAEQLLAEQPDDIRLQFALAATRGSVGDLDGAETAYRQITSTNPQFARAWVELSQVLSRKNQSEEAQAVIDEGLKISPQDGNLLWAKASYLEQDGDAEGAIAVYEDMYERASNSIIIANNLASLLATYREDDASLERAHVVARRLRGTEVPSMQDTYGWILHRRGESAEALTYLEPAAAKMVNEPIVQYHLAVTYLALDRPKDALAQFIKAVDIAGPGDTRDQIEKARAEISRLSSQ